MNTKGIVYVASGDNYIKEAIISAKSAKALMPDLPITLFTDSQGYREQNLFDEIIVINDAPDSSFFKVLCLNNSPYNKTLLMDTDTLFIDHCYELFDLLECFDLAVAHAPNRTVFEIPECPLSFPELNTGVIAFNNCLKINNLFQDWEKIYRQQHENGLRCDQPSFRLALFRSDVRLTVLTPEYNLRTWHVVPK